MKLFRIFAFSVAMFAIGFEVESIQTRSAQQQTIRAIQQTKDALAAYDTLKSAFDEMSQANQENEASALSCVRELNDSTAFIERMRK